MPSFEEGPGRGCVTKGVISLQKVLWRGQSVCWHSGEQ